MKACTVIALVALTAYLLGRVNGLDNVEGLPPWGQSFFPVNYKCNNELLLEQYHGIVIEILVASCIFLGYYTSG